MIKDEYGQNPDLYKDLTLEKIEEVLKDIIYNGATESKRKVKMHFLSEASYNMFHEALKKEFEKYGK